MDVVDRSHIPSPLSTSISLPSQRMEPSEQQVRNNQVGRVVLYGVPIVSLIIDGSERLCLAQISNTLLKDFSYNEIHNRRVALGITCVQCTPVQLEILRRAGAMPISSRRCGMISKREAERLCKSFLGDNSPPKLPENFAFDVFHECAWGCRGSFVPSRYNSSRAKCIKCFYCSLFFSPNKFVFHSHRLGEGKYVQPDAANFNSWRRHIRLFADPPDDIIHAWEDVKAMFNGGTRKRLMQHSTSHDSSSSRLPKQPRLGSNLPKGSAFPSPPVKTLPGADVTAGGYASYFGTTMPLAQPYPIPVAQKALDMRQSFVDYLWGSRTGIPSLGLPYPLPWPKRPLPSFPPFSLAGQESILESQEVPTERVTSEKSELALKQTSASAFTPVNRPTPPPSPRIPPTQEGLRSWKRDEPKGGLLWEDVTVLPDSSKLSDDEESVDVESNDENTSKKRRETLTQEARADEEVFPKGVAVPGSSVSSVSAIPCSSPSSMLSRTSTPPSPCQTSAMFHSSKAEKASSNISSSISPSSPTSSNPSSSTFPSTLAPLDSPFCLIPEEDPRIRLFLLREMEARRRMEVEMARLKYSYSAHFQPPSLHPTVLHHSALSSGALPPNPHLPLGSKDWLENSAGAASSSQ